METREATGDWGKGGGTKELSMEHLPAQPQSKFVGDIFHRYFRVKIVLDPVTSPMHISCGLRRADYHSETMGDGEL